MEKVEIIVLGDVYWDTVVVRLPSDKGAERPENAYVRMDRLAGALLLESLIRKAAKSDSSIDVKGYIKARECDRDRDLDTLCALRKNECLKPDEWRRALSVLGLYPKSDTEEKEEVYRIRPKEWLGWVAYPGDCDKHYTVQPGDTLRKIAGTEYGDGGKHRQIVEANKLLLPSLDKIDPGQELPLGQELRIPRSWASNEKENRERVFKSLNDALAVKDTPEDAGYSHRIVVISETENHPFRSLDKNVEFVKNISCSDNTYLVLCMAHPLGEGALWEMVKKNEQLLDRTLVVISAASLRAGGLYVREQAAQETIALELARKFEKPEIQDLNKCPHIVVRFDYDSVFHYDTRNKYCANESGQGYFDNYLRPFEGGPQTNPGRYGTMSGYGKILVASIVKEMAEGIKTGTPFDRLGKGICDGLRRGAAHFRNGFAAKGFKTDYLTKGSEPTPFEDLFNKRSSIPNTTPIKDLFRESKIRDNNGHLEAQIQEKAELLPLLAKVHMPCNERTLETWSRVQGLEKELKDERTFEAFLLDVVKIGLKKALDDKKHKTNVVGLLEDEWPIACPFLKLGDLISIERKELDGFNDVYVLIQKYLQNDATKKPLSLAVFGPPGTGKSFAVQEIMKAAGSFSGKSATAPLENNLSQFTEAKNLARAFHRAQDVGLSGKVPLVFFDEFDASLPQHPYAWLKYFLAPMQDGKFKAAESEDTYTVGRAIFVFAGGTAFEFEEFERKVSKETSTKGPDFISRLRGYLNILSINGDNDGRKEKDKSEKKPESKLRQLVQAIDRLTQRINTSSTGIDENGEEPPKDKETSEPEPIKDCRLLLRRAILLRSVLEREASEIIDSKKQARIDEGLIKAFLKIPRYQHRMRSMEAIVNMARPDKNWLRVASLPSRDQLGMHVDAELFLELAQQLPDAASGATDSTP